MMEGAGIKLPVFRTFFRALGFTIWNGWTIYRLSWFPFALLTATTVALPFVFLRNLAVRATENGAAVSVPPFEGMASLQVASIILQLIATASVAVSIHRVILFGERQPGHYFLFAFGRTELLYMSMAIASTLFTVIAIALVLVPFVTLISGGDPIAYLSSLFPKAGGKPGSANLGGLAAGYFLAWIFAGYFMLRLAVWPPAIVATKRLSLGDAWQLTKGNVLRLFGLFLLPLLVMWFPIVLAVAAYWYVNAPHEPPPAAATPSEQTTPVPAGSHLTSAALAAMTSMQLALQGTPPSTDPMGTEEKTPPAHEQIDGLPIAPFFNLWLFQFFFEIYLTAFGVALLSYSYKALMGIDAGEPIQTPD